MSGMSRTLGLLGLVSILSLVGCERTGKEAAPPRVPTGAEQVGSDPQEANQPGLESGGEDPAGSEKPSLPSSGERVAIVPESHALYGRLEVPDMPNACESDANCHVGGCGGETCSAEPEVITTCELLPVRFPEGSQCGCVEGQCRWWHPEGAALIEMGASTRRPEPTSGEAPADALAACGAQRCKPGQECVTHHADRGPQHHSCEWRCRPDQPNDGCPEGTRCEPLGDGPERVCR
jgi:eight-cysteine-cluster-containing protein